MTELYFEMARDVDLPIEVYDSELRLVGRSLSSAAVSVTPGTYFVEARLPDGSQLHRTVEVAGEAAHEVVLGELPREDRFGMRSPGLATEEAPTIRETMTRRGPGLVYAEQEMLGQPLGLLATFRLEALGGWQPVEQRPIPPWTGRWTVTLPDAGVGAIGLERADGSMTIVRVPEEQGHLLQFEIVGDRERGPLELRGRVASEPANALLSFLNLDLIEDAEVLTHSQELQGEELLRGKLADPLAAAAGALALLRMNALDRLHDWTSNLALWFPWLPDGAIVRAEHLARVGRHEEAANLLREVPRRGLPVLSLAFASGVDRLRTYAGFWPDDRELKRALVILTRYAMATDFSQTVTTFSGRAPDSPEPAWLWRRPGAGSGSSEGVSTRPQGIPEELV